MSLLNFPCLPGLTWDLKLTPAWSTVVQQARNRTVTRGMNSPWPLWNFELTFEFLRSSPNTGTDAARNANHYTELDQIVGLFNQCGGQFGDFYLDPSVLTGCGVDNRFAAQIGTGDGTTTAFPLVRNQGGFHDLVQNPVGPVQVAVNGAPQTAGSNYTIDGRGVVNFAAAPAANAVLTASGQWKWRCRFADDSLNITAFMFQLYELQSLKLVEVRL